MRLLNGKLVRAARRAKGFKTQEALAKALGVAATTVGRIERQECAFSPKLYTRLAQLVGKPLEELSVDGVPAKQSPETQEVVRALGKIGPAESDFVVALVLALAEGGTVDAAISAGKMFSRIRALRRDGGESA
jgi:DNA-binding XRE family transcriptional regulator